MNGMPVTLRVIVLGTILIISGMFLRHHEVIETGGKASLIVFGSSFLLFGLASFFFQLRWKNLGRACAVAAVIVLVAGFAVAGATLG